MLNYDKITINAYNTGFHDGYEFNNIEPDNKIIKNEICYTAYLVGKEEGLYERFKECE